MYTVYWIVTLVVLGQYENNQQIFDLNDSKLTSHNCLASPQTSFGVRLSLIQFSREESVTNEPQRTSAGRLIIALYFFSYAPLLTSTFLNATLYAWCFYEHSNWTEL